jgi:hypothetical protein
MPQCSEHSACSHFTVGVANPEAGEPLRDAIFSHSRAEGCRASSFHQDHAHPFENKSCPCWHAKADSNILSILTWKPLFPNHSPMISRRSFLATSLAAAASPVSASEDTRNLKAKIDSHRPSIKSYPPTELRQRIGTTLVHGKYHLSQQPVLLEGAAKMIEMGTRLGKFWFNPSRVAQDYSFNSQWPKVSHLAELAATPYWGEVFSMPFHTLILIAECPLENGWQDSQNDEFYQRITREFEELTRSLYQKHKDRDLTIILQNWEGDWQLRGIGESWSNPPADWKTRCDRFAKRLTARQLGVTRARTALQTGSKLRVLHAAEVNRVTDQWRGIPTMTEHVLPKVSLDLVSYSCYDAMKDGTQLFKAIETVRRFANTQGPDGPGAVYLGEIGIPENIAKHQISARWDELIGAALAAKVLHIAQWQLYCNELNPKFEPHPKQPIHESWRMRGFWLFYPDGSLTESGRFFSKLWQK